MALSATAAHPRGFLLVQSLRGGVRRWRGLVALAGYAEAAVGVAATTGAIGTVLSVVGVTNMSSLYLIVILAMAVRYGFGPAVFASVLSFLAFNWFHIHPVHTLHVAAPGELLALLLFLTVAVVTGRLAAAQRRRAEEARRREAEARAMHEIGRLLAEQEDLDLALAAVVDHLRTELRLVGCALLLADQGTMAGADGPRLCVRTVAGEVPPNAPEAHPSDTADAPLAQSPSPYRGWLAGRSASSHGRWAQQVESIPLRAGDRTAGVLQLVSPAERVRWTPEEARLVVAAADRLGLAIERERLRREATAAEVLRRSDEAHRALLASVSHDLRTPLASIKASAGSLLQQEVHWSDDERRVFALAIEQESDRLNQIVQELLDMTRIEAGAIRPDRDWYLLDALVDEVVRRFHAASSGHRVMVDMPEDLPPVPLDYVQIGQVLYNLLDNAFKYTPPGSTVRISARSEGERVLLSVTDDGPGIPIEAMPRIFEKFYRVRSGDTAGTTGTGLGLAVARGFVEAHGGSLIAQSPPPGESRGTIFTLCLPERLSTAPAPLEEDGDLVPGPFIARNAVE